MLIYCVHYSWDLKMEAVLSFEKLVD
jgi:hypothetical protein